MWGEGTCVEALGEDTTAAAADGAFGGGDVGVGEVVGEVGGREGGGSIGRGRVGLWVVSLSGV